MKLIYLSTVCFALVSTAILAESSSSFDQFDPTRDDPISLQFSKQENSDNSFMLSQNDRGTPQEEINGTSAAGEPQKTIIDESGNLKVQDGDQPAPQEGEQQEATQAPLPEEPPTRPSVSPTSPTPTSPESTRVPIGGTPGGPIVPGTSPPGQPPQIGPTQPVLPQQMAPSQGVAPPPAPIQPSEVQRQNVMPSPSVPPAPAIPETPKAPATPVNPPFVQRPNQSLGLPPVQTPESLPPRGTVSPQRPLPGAEPVNPNAVPPANPITPQPSSAPPTPNQGVGAPSPFSTPKDQIEMNQGLNRHINQTNIPSPLTPPNPPNVAR